MIVTTLRRGRVAVALLAVVTTLAISVAPSYAAQGGFNAPTVICGGSGNCA